MSSGDQDSGGKEMPQIKSTWEEKGKKEEVPNGPDPLRAATRFVD